MNEKNIDISNKLEQHFNDVRGSLDGLSIEAKLLKIFFLKSDQINDPLQLISSVDGEIEYLLTSSVEGSFKCERFTPEFKKIVEPKSLIYFDEVKCEGLHDNNWISSSLNIDGWIQDSFIVAKYRQKESYFVIFNPHLSDENEKSMIEKVVEKMSKIGKKDFQICPSFIHINGGNLLVGDDFFFIGSDEIKRLHDMLGYAENLKKYLSQIFETVNLWDIAKSIIQKTFDPNRKLIEISNNEIVENIREGIKADKFLLDPLVFRKHIDFFITIGGRNPKGQYVIFLGKPELIRQRQDGGLPSVNLFLEKIGTWYDQMKTYLLDNIDQNNVKVVCLKLPLYSRIIEEGEDGAKERYFAYSYNNCLVQNTSHQKKISVPSYADPYYLKPKDVKILEPYDIKALERFLDFGFKNSVLTNYFTKTIDEGAGSLHCVSKTLIRKMELDKIRFDYDKSEKSYLFKINSVKHKGLDFNKEYVVLIDKDLEFKCDLKENFQIKNAIEYQITEMKLEKDLSNERPKGRISYNDFNPKGTHLKSYFFVIGSDDERLSRGVKNENSFHIKNIGLTVSPFITISVNDKDHREMNKRNKIVIKNFEGEITPK